MSKSGSKSEYKNTLKNNALVTVLSKARDLAIHSSSLKGAHKKKVWRYLSEAGENLVENNSIFFDEINKDMLDKKVSYISQEELDWFNKQGEQWPVYLLIREAIYQSSFPIANFLTVNNQRVQWKVKERGR